MDGWSLALLVAAGYVATMALVRLMIGRRDQLLDQFRRRMRAGKKLRQTEQEQQPQQQNRAA